MYMGIDIDAAERATINRMKAATLFAEGQRHWRTISRLISGKATGKRQALTTWEEESFNFLRYYFDVKSIRGTREKDPSKFKNDPHLVCGEWRRLSYQEIQKEFNLGRFQVKCLLRRLETTNLIRRRRTKLYDDASGRWTSVLCIAFDVDSFEEVMRRSRKFDLDARKIVVAEVTHREDRPKSNSSARNDRNKDEESAAQEGTRVAASNDVNPHCGINDNTQRSYSRPLIINIEGNSSTAQFNLHNTDRDSKEKQSPLGRGPRSFSIKKANTTTKGRQPGDKIPFVIDSRTARNLEVIEAGFKGFGVEFKLTNEMLRHIDFWTNECHDERYRMTPENLRHYFQTVGNGGGFTLKHDDRPSPWQLDCEPSMWASSWHKIQEFLIPRMMAREHAEDLDYSRLVTQAPKDWVNGGLEMLSRQLMGREWDIAELVYGDWMNDDQFPRFSFTVCASGDHIVTRFVLANQHRLDTQAFCRKFSNQLLEFLERRPLCYAALSKLGYPVNEWVSYTAKGVMAYVKLKELAYNERIRIRGIERTIRSYGCDEFVD